MYLVKLRSKQFLRDDYHSVIYLQTLGNEERVHSTRNKNLFMEICTVLKEIPRSSKAVQVTYSFMIVNLKWSSTDACINTLVIILSKWDKTQPQINAVISWIFSHLSGFEDQETTFDLIINIIHSLHQTQYTLTVSKLERNMPIKQTFSHKFLPFPN